MNRFLCLWLPNWPIHRLVVEQPELGDRPVVLYIRDRRQRQRVQACSSRARALGVRQDMPLADATALIAEEPFFVQPHDPDGDQQALTKLADWCGQFSPLVAIDSASSPDSLYLDLDGVTHLHGDEPTLAEHVLRKFCCRGYRPRVAIASTPAAAWAAARHSGKSWTIVPASEIRPLLELPLAALRLPAQAEQQLARLGVHRIGQLVELPRESLPSRVGAEVLERLDCLTGDRPETLSGYQPPPVFEQQWRLEQATTHRETVLHIVGVLLERLASQLVRHDQGVSRLTIRLDGTTGPPLRIDIRLYRPGADARRLDRLARMQLETVQNLAAVECVTVVAEETATLEPLQQSLLTSERSVDPRELADLVERLGSRLGPQRVVQAVPVDDWQPEKAFRYQPLASPNQRQTAVPGEPPGERPLRMFSPPRPVSVLAVFPDGPPARFDYQGEQRIAGYQGPERLETAWWRGVCIKRDYYLVETGSACRFWLFRRLDDGQWFLHGSFD